MSADPEPVVDEEGEETGAYHCPECHDICWNEAKALACCADEDETTDSPRESTVEGQSRNANPCRETGKSVPLSGAAFDPIDDPEFDPSTEAVREHYRRAGPVLDALENVGAFPTSAFAGNSGWYRYTDAGDLDREAFDAGYRSFRRAYTIENDREELLDAIEFDPDEDSWRSLYAITSYKDPEALYAGAYSKERRGGFDGGEGLPDYADIRALPFWIYVDLADDRDDALDREDENEYGADLKARRGDLDPRELRIVERAFEEIVAEVATVYDLPPEAIAAFDSGGGGYPFGPAAATVPVAERYDDEERERLFDELTDRMNAYVAGDADTPGTVEAYGFEGIVPRVERKVPGAKYLLDADALLNKNRQTKAPGAIHKSHDAVVTPLRDADGEVDYTPTTVSEFGANDDLRERTATETRKFTEDTPEARACVEPLVATLFPEYADREDLDGWAEVLDAWLTDDWARRRARIHATARDDLRRRERRKERREELAEELDREPTDDEVSDALANQQITTVRQDQFDDLDRIDTEGILRTYAADEWDTSNRGHETTFDPNWRTSGSGKSCAVPNGSDTFVDNKCDGGGGPAKAYALGTEILPQTKDAAAMSLRGQKWGEAVDGLRGEGHDIRVYVPEADEKYDETPLGALRRAAVALDVCSPDEFKEHETDDGETYLGFDRETFNDVLDALDEAGVDHGREHIDGGEGVEPVPSIPFGMLMRPRDELVRYARKRGLDWPETDEVSDRIGDALRDTMRRGGYAVLDAPTASNKTGEAAETVWRDVDEAITGGQPVVMFCETTDARNEAEQRAREAGLDVKVLRGYKELCPVARGDYDPKNCDDALVGEVVEVGDGEDNGVDTTRTDAEYQLTVEYTDPQTGATETTPVPTDEEFAVGDEYTLAEAEQPIYIEGELGSDWMEERVEKRSLPVSTVHVWMKELAAKGYIGHTEEKSAAGTGYVEPPCCPGDAKCHTATQWPPEGEWKDDDGVPRYDLVLATDPFAYVPALRQDKNLIHDEQPDYTDDLGTDGDPRAVTERVRGILTAYFGLTDDGPKTFEEFVTTARAWNQQGLVKPSNEHAAPDERVPGEAWGDMMGVIHHDPVTDWYFETSDAHTLAPALAQALFWALFDGEEHADGRRHGRTSHEPPRLDADAGDDPGWNKTYVSVVIDAENTIHTVRNTPGLGTARSVVGLDAWPEPHLWQRNVHPNVTVERVLDADERALWRRLERGLTVVQVGDATRPPGKNGKYFTKEHADVLVAQLTDTFGEDFRAAGCASAVEDELRELLEEHGVSLPPEKTMDFSREAVARGEDGGTLHFGEEKSLNSLADELVGLVYGCIDPGDDYVLNLAAECDLDVQPATHECTDCDGEGCPGDDDCYDGERRDRGREFVGDDAEAGAALLASVRENHVAQMAGRFGRSEDLDQSVVFVATDAVPPGFADMTVPGVTWLARPNQKQRDLIEYLRRNPQTTAKEAAETVGCSKKHAWAVFKALVAQDKATVRPTAGPEGADVYRWQDGAAAGAGGSPFATVELTPENVGDATVTSAVWSTYTWEVTIRPDRFAESGSATSSSAANDAEVLSDGGVPPPDRVE